ncbi:MAG: DUF3306 domain-containing protein [Alphaproteobacteria bacterium]|nr:DUF3306 domain-containing protein [Alphaproteobacteria bacterium]
MPNDRFLNRWSRMKAKSRPARGAAAVASYTVEEDVVEDIALDANDSVQDTASLVQDTDAVEVESELSDQELAEKAKELGLPALDSLGPGSDFKAFMASTVPAQLRNLALRKLWRSNPVLANLDGLIDYGDDFTDAGTVVANMQTAYQVGRGYKRDPEPELLAEEDQEDLNEDHIAAAESDQELTPEEDAEIAEDTNESDLGLDENLAEAPEPVGDDGQSAIDTTGKVRHA